SGKMPRPLTSSCRPSSSAPSRTWRRWWDSFRPPRRRRPVSSSSTNRSRRSSPAARTSCPRTTRPASNGRGLLFGEEEAHTGRRRLLFVLEPTIERLRIRGRDLRADGREQLFGPKHRVGRALDEDVRRPGGAPHRDGVPDRLALPRYSVVLEGGVQFRPLRGRDGEE